MKKISIIQMTYVSMFTVLIIIGAFIKVPVPVVPFTLQFLFTMLAGLLLGLGLPGGRLLPGRLRLLLGRLGGVGVDRLDAGDLVVLGQALKDQRQLPIPQNLHMVFGRLGILGQNLRDLLGGDAEVLRHLMHSVFVTYATQIEPPPSL